ncbi:MAG TPA: hypothetical protein VGK99_17045 [Acidobacteriota bacterium]|jgi:hypothetical protein
MSNFQVRPEQTRAARKILQVLSDEFAISTREQSFLLHAISMIALRHSLENGALQWNGPDERVRLFFDRDQVRLEENAPHPLVLHRAINDEESGGAYELVEKLLDLHEIPEHERSALFSALPCLGFQALQHRFIEWKVEPPFKTMEPETREKKEQRKRRRS